MPNLKITGVRKNKNAKDSWEVWYMDLEGKRIYETVKAPTKSDAFKIRQQRIQEVESGSYIKQDKITVNELFDIFKTEYESWEPIINYTKNYEGKFTCHVSIDFVTYISFSINIKTLRYQSYRGGGYLRQKEKKDDHYKFFRNDHNPMTITMGKCGEI